MTASPTLLLTVYCIAIALASMAGGLLPGRVRMTHTRIQLVMSFVSGLMLTVALFHLLPHAIAIHGTAGAVDYAIRWVMVGLIAMLVLLRLFHFHQHDFSAEEDEHHDHHHDHNHGAPSGLGWVGVALGLGLHTLIDGIALGALMQGDVATHGSGVLGVGVFLAILLHKPLDAMSITALMAASGVRRTRLVNIAFALMCPLGAMLFYVGIDLAGAHQAEVISAALAFSAGAFMCIALSDLLPEVHFHSHDRGVLTLAFLAGILLALAIGGLEPDTLHPGTH